MSTQKQHSIRHTIYFFIFSVLCSSFFLFYYFDTHPKQFTQISHTYGLPKLLILCILGIYGIRFFLHIFIFYYKKHQLVRCGITKMDTMTGEEFEEFLKQLFVHMGYQVEMTPKTGDYGADLLLTSKEGLFIVVQAKRYSKKVPVKAIQEVIGAKAYYRADSSAVITNNYFTQNAVKLAESTQTELWDRERLQEVLLQQKHKYKL